MSRILPALLAPSLLLAQHWADQPLQRPAPTAPAAPSIDAFAAATRQLHGLPATGAADASTWLRRVALDLTGIPPSSTDLTEFLADASPTAKERAVDRLLASPRYGERWTQWWLDLARYADSQGYESDRLRTSMWRYRDWVIDALQGDMPLDAFTLRQLAGDLLPDATLEDHVATAFHRQTMSNSEGGTDNEEFRVAAIVDRVDTTLSVWMGATAGCAQCHDHKYDPISQREFFSLFAFFDQTADTDQNDDKPLLTAPTKVQQQRAVALAPDDAQFAAQPISLGTWHSLGPLVAESIEAAHALAMAPETEGVQLATEQAGQSWQERANYVDGKVHNWRGDRSAMYLFRTLHAKTPVRATLSLGSDDSIVAWWNGKEVLRKQAGRAAAPDQEVLPVSLRQGENTLLLKISNGGGIAGFYFQLEPPSHAVRFADTPPEVPVMVELPADQRRTTRVHLRGNFLTQGDVVQADTPRAWPPLPADAPRNRLGLARWLMADNNPRTARVFANRIWAELFGQGLVTTLEDFGSQGEAPSHPELLDFLARELRDRGWSLKQFLRTIVLSATYGRSAAASQELRELDPTNRMLTRGPSFRMSGEMLRDQALAVSGLLVEQIGGPSVMPPQPDGIWMQIYNANHYQAAQDRNRYRRALYTIWRRTSPHPQMLIFDAMSREACVLRRQRTNTPLQVLNLWNDPQFYEPARQLGQAVASQTGDDGSKLDWLWQRCLLRLPHAQERNRLLELLHDERARLQDDAQAWYVVAGVMFALDEFVTRP